MTITLSMPGRAIPSSPVRVLIVEDHPDLARVTALCLEHHAFQTRTVDRGDLAHAAAVAFRPHFVLLDIGLPGLDGYQVSRAIREDASLEQSVIIALSAYGSRCTRITVGGRPSTITSRSRSTTIACCRS